MFDYICQISHRYIYRIYDYCQNFSRNEPVALFGTRVEEIVSVDFMEWKEEHGKRRIMVGEFR